MEIKPLKENSRIYRDNKGRLYTKNLVKGQSVYEEKLVQYKGEEYREWIVNRSKLAAAIVKKIGEVPINEGNKVLYLGIAAGTTASHISDIIGNRGMIYGVEISARILQELVRILDRRRNIIPILSDASKPYLYLHIVPKVDILYQDVAQPHQIKIFIDNVDYYLKRSGYGFLAVKSRSIDVREKPKVIFERVRKELENHGLTVLREVRLDPYHIDHAMFLVRK